MVVNFRARGISRGARKLARTPTLNKKKKKNHTLPTSVVYELHACNELQVSHVYMSLYVI